MNVLQHCPLCGGTTGFSRKVLIEYEVQYDWVSPADPHFEERGTDTVYKRRYCMDCKGCVSKPLDAPTFKL